MDANYFTNPLSFLVQILFGFYIMIVILRFLLQLFKADFYNPISQFIVKLTSPVLTPIRRVIPGIAGLDISSLLLAWALMTLELMLIYAIAGAGMQLVASLLLAIPELVDLIINIFLFSIIIQVILSWLGQVGYNPAASLIYSITEPLLGPARRLIKPIGGLDLSPMLAMVGLTLLKMLLIPPLQMIAKQLA